MCKASPPRSGVSSPHSYDCVILQHSEAATKSFHCRQSVMIRASIYVNPFYCFYLTSPHKGGAGGEVPCRGLGTLSGGQCVGAPATSPFLCVCLLRRQT